MFRIEGPEGGPLTLVSQPNTSVSGQRSSGLDTELRATFAPARGGLVTAFSRGSDDFLFLDDATFRDPSANVRGGIPVLFPFPGKLVGDRYLAEGRAYALGQHGFARRRAFSEVSRTTEGRAAVTAVLEDDAETRAVYPYHFRLSLEVALTDRLTITTTVENTGSKPLPWALGFHPYFAIPDGQKKALTVAHAATRAWDNRKQRMESAPESLQFASKEELDLHLLDDPSPKKILLRDGVPWLELAFQSDASPSSAPVWVFWTVPGKNYVCVEPWTAPGRALATGERLCLLPAGARASYAFTLLPR